MSDQSSKPAVDYQEFIRRKSQLGSTCGFEPVFLPDFLFDFQRSLVEWAIRKGRAAIFADCGLGKTPMQLVWAENVVRKTNGRVLILTPLAVGSQTVREGEKFGIDCEQSRTGKFSKRIVVTNYQRLHYFNPEDFDGVVADESSILKNFDAKTKDAVVDFMRTRPYRLLCTATAAPNDYVELGNSAEALGELGFADMVTRFFRKETSKDHLGWGRTKYRLRGHATTDFWRWICSWARAVRKPSDLGFDDGEFILPLLLTREYLIESKNKRNGFLFDVPAQTLQEQREERRRTLQERCEKVAELINGTGKPAIAWCHLNDEGDEITRLIPDAKQASGSDSDERKEELLLAFAAGKLRVLVTKPVLACWGLNFQHCAHQVFFPSDSFEQYYQAVRRCWRFGQKNPVQVDVIASEGGAGVLANLQRKADKANAMFSALVEQMNDVLQLRRGNPFTNKAEKPSWLTGGISSVLVEQSSSQQNGHKYAPDVKKN
jgi:hypothetical protein